MAIRLPLKVVETFTDSNDTGTGSTAGMINHPFLLPQDTDNVVVKVTASVSGTGVSAVLQTSDDGGTTYYDIGRTSIVSNANGTTAQWLAVGTTTPGFRSAVQGQNSVAGATLGQSEMSGLPILGRQGRVGIIIDGDVTSAAANEVVTKVMVNQQSATA